MRRLLLIAVGLLMGLTAMAQANQDPYYARRATLFDELPIGKKDIVMLGNSLTDGCEFNELLNNRHIKNRGIVGDIVQGLIDRIGPIIEGQPKKLFIMSGVNDISHDVSADSIARVTEKLIMMVKKGSPRTKIYLQSLLPFNNDVREWKLLKGREHVVVEANVLLEQVAHRQGVTWINLYPLFVDDQGRLRAELTKDGLHLMGQGYLIWRDAIKPYIK
ncbi:MAG: sialate O-acetylesterase [Muribaculaceae bacterium]|nr:sialate O-acetylesterase [Muribaculaceae bacterium]